ncbi:hypothetical protein KC351_g3316 [Hortaea werneckii]|nr:hypothetical protein KC351_g3316 [Hortaea werneckii]
MGRTKSRGKDKRSQDDVLEGYKGKPTKDINWGISQTKTNNAEFINCMTPSGGNDNYGDARAEDIHKNENTKATVKLEELMLMYPSSMQRTWIDLDRSW